MYAVIETGGKQYRVELGTELEVELLDVEPGQEINLDRVLLVVDGDKSAVGQPVVADAAVSARVLRQDRGEKTISFKYRPKARRRVKKGHRQELTVLKITDVRLGAKSAAEEAKEAESAAEAEREQGRQGRRPPGRGGRGTRREAQGPQPPPQPRKRSPRRRRPRPRPRPLPPRKRPAKGREPGQGEVSGQGRAKPAKAAPAKAAPKTAKADTTDKPAGEAPAKRPARTKKDE